jgi:hypothetical protein
MSSDYRALSGDLTAVMHVEVDELFVRREQLGSILETEHEGKTVRVELPQRDERRPFRLHLLPSELAISGSTGPKEDPQLLHAVRLVQVHVELGRGLGGEGSGNAEYVLLREAEPAAQRIVRTLLDWARTHGRQAWLLPPHMLPPVVGPAWLVNRQGDRTHPYPLQSKPIVMFRENELPEGDVRKALGGEEAPLAESLLAEARWAVWPGQDPDTKRAALFAAIALEVKTPEALMRAAGDQTRDVLDTLFSRPDESKMSVNFQLNELARSVCGQALRERDGTLAKRVREIFIRRNDVAHRGLTPDVNDAMVGVGAAEMVFAWLDSLPVPNGSAPGNSAQSS